MCSINGFLDRREAVRQTSRQEGQNKEMRVKEERSISFLIYSFLHKTKLKIIKVQDRFLLLLCVPATTYTGFLLCLLLIQIQILSVQFSCSVVSNSLRPHESQHARYFTYVQILGMEIEFHFNYDIFSYVYSVNLENKV